MQLDQNPYWEKTAVRNICQQALAAAQIKWFHWKTFSQNSYQKCPIVVNDADSYVDGCSHWFSATVATLSGKHTGRIWVGLSTNSNSSFVNTFHESINKQNFQQIFSIFFWLEDSLRIIELKITQCAWLSVQWREFPYEKGPVLFTIHST